MNAPDARVLLLPLACLVTPLACSSTGDTSFPNLQNKTSGADAGSQGQGGSGGNGAGGGTSSGNSGPSGASSGSSPSASGSGSGGVGSGSGASSGASNSGPSSSGGSGAGGTTLDGGTVWSPTAAAPIHFHWMIGGFGTADILSHQAGAVVYDIDGENSTAADVTAIHATGAIAVCYVDVGTLEQGRSDHGQFPSSVVGPAVAGWPGENWLLVTAANQSVILPLMKARFLDWCQAKGFDAIEPDNVDGWTNISGISQADNVAYDMAIAQLAHSLPLSVGLKNVAAGLSASQLSSFVGTFDWALSEQCYEFNECAAYAQAGSFLPANKAVFDVEYNTSPNCTQATQSHMNAQFTDLGLVGATASGYKYTPCVPDNQATW